MKIVFYSALFAVSLLVAFAAGAYFAADLAKDHYIEDLDYERKQNLELQKMMPNVLASQSEISFRIDSALSSIRLLESGNTEEHIKLMCAYLEVFSSGLKPELAETDTEKEKLIDLEGRASAKMKSLRTEARCITTAATRQN